MYIQKLQRYALALVFIGLFPANIFAQSEDAPDLDAINKIKAEEFQRPKVLEIESYLSDVYGPRLTGSPNLKLAADYVQKQLNEYGLVNVHLEKFPFGRGWSNERFYVHAISPQAYPLIGFVKAWTPGTNGLVSGEAVWVDIQSEDDLAKYKGKLKGKFVLMEPLRDVTPPFLPLATRLTDAELSASTMEGEPRVLHHRNPADVAEAKKRNALEPKEAQFLLQEGVLATLQPSPAYPSPIPTADGGTVIQTNGIRSGSQNPKDPQLPTMVVIAVEHYNRMLRTLQKGIPVTLEMNIQNKFYDQDLEAFNVIGEIPGTDKADEVVMLGAHLDSWHMGTGATDNGSGAATMIEAVRLLKATGLKMRRTVRIGLWSGEEQGILGSRAYVTQHFYDPNTGEVKPEHANLSAYFNSDDGAGAIRGIGQQSIEAAGPIFKSWIEPFRNLGMTTVSIRGAVSTDVVSFDGAGLPAFMFMQDSLDYVPRTHHTNMDVYDRIVPVDMLKNSLIIAVFVYQTANRDQMMPRKPMPKRNPQAAKH